MIRLLLGRQISSIEEVVDRCSDDVERVAQLVCDAAGADAKNAAAVSAAKRRAILRVLDVEEPHLPTCAKMIAHMRAALAVG